MNYPQPQDFGWQGLDPKDLTTGQWTVDGGEQQYFEAINKWEKFQDDKAIESLYSEMDEDAEEGSIDTRI